MILAAHQPNFIPRFAFFQKIHESDIFVLLINCQFSKGGYQNRAKVFDSWWTKPVKKGLKPIKDKYYTDGHSVIGLNLMWIIAIAQTLGIDTTKICIEPENDKTSTDRLIWLCKKYKCDKYLTNPKAKEKYLEITKMKDSGIQVIPFKNKTDKHVFELFKTIGIEKTRRLLT